MPPFDRSGRKCSGESQDFVLPVTGREVRNGIANGSYPLKDFQDDRQPRHHPIPLSHGAATIEDGGAGYFRRQPSITDRRYIAKELPDHFTAKPGFFLAQIVAEVEARTTAMNHLEQILSFSA